MDKAASVVVRWIYYDANMQKCGIVALRTEKESIF
jgi:hypothetical protein